MNSKREPSAETGGGAALVPKRRFSQFQNAKPWKPKRLGALFSQREETGGTNPRLLSLTDKDGIIPQEASNRRNTASGDLGKYLRVMPGDIAYNTMRMWEGRSALSRLEGIVSPAYTVCSPTKEAHSAFFSYYFKTPELISQFARYSQGLVKDTLNLKFENFARIVAATPPTLSEQQMIADCLDSVDALIAGQGRKVEALGAYKKGLMQQLFPQDGETQPRLRLPEFEGTGKWAEIQLSKLVSALDAGVSVNSGDRRAMGHEIGILKTSAVTNGIFDPFENKFVFDEEEIKRVREPVRADTVIISRMNTPALVGANAYVKDDYPNLFLPDRLWAAKPRSGADMRFVALVLGSDRGRAALSGLAGGSSGSMKNISKPSVLELVVMAPSRPEQQRIADCLTSLIDLIAAETRKLDTLKTHKKGLMQQLFPQV